jgi:hypothetical protein
LHELLELLSAARLELTARHYADTSDNPTWVSQGSTTQRYAELIGGDLALTIDQTGAADLTVANPHGDIVTTVDLPSGTAAAEGIVGWNNYNEYGNAADATESTGILNSGGSAESNAPYPAPAPAGHNRDLLGLLPTPGTRAIIL